MPSASPHLSEWTQRAKTEPRVRIGVIIDEDHAQSVQIAAGPAGAPLDIIDDSREASAKLPASATFVARRDGDSMLVRLADDEIPRRATTVRLRDPDQPPRARGGLRVHDVIAGRGFHWQTRIDQSLPGTLELTAGPRGLVLVNELPLESYLAGVITAEMSGECPAALLEAQCIVARSWLLAMTEPKHVDEPFDRCNDDCCQRYQGAEFLTDAALAAVRATHGRVLLAPNDDVLDANYAKSCGGISELPQNVWGKAKPGLSAVIDAPPGDPARTFAPITPANLDDYLEGGWLSLTRAYCSPRAVPIESIGRYLGHVDTVDDYFRWQVRYSGPQLTELLRERLPDGREMAAVRDLRVTARGLSGRAVAMEIDWQDFLGRTRQARLGSEYEIRQSLHAKFLYSSAFAVRSTRDESGCLTEVTLHGAGWGHGVGMCQIGALGMALAGHDADAICRHYYPLARLATVY